MGVGNTRSLETLDVPCHDSTVVQFLLVRLVRQSFFPTSSYAIVNLRFTYLLTYLLTRTR